MQVVAVNLKPADMSCALLLIRGHMPGWLGSCLSLSAIFPPSAPTSFHQLFMNKYGNRTNII